MYWPSSRRSYRTSNDSLTVRAPIDAAVEMGKSVTAPLKVVSEREANIVAGRDLERAGVPSSPSASSSWKTHSKMSLVVRREEGKLRTYSPSRGGTGNYHPDDGVKIYTGPVVLHPQLEDRPMRHGQYL